MMENKEQRVQQLPSDRQKHECQPAQAAFHAAAPAREQANSVLSPADQVLKQYGIAVVGPAQPAGQAPAASIVEYGAADQEAWDRAVRSFPDYDVFYLSDYSRAFMLENPQYGQPALLVYTAGEDRAMSVVFKRDVALDMHLRGKVASGMYYDLITPYGYGGFTGRISDWARLSRTYVDYCTAHHYVCEFVRFNLFSDYYRHYDGEVETRTHNVVRSLDMPLDEMWMDFKQKVRKNVKKANSYQLSILIESTPDHLDDFLRIYYATMIRTDAEKNYYFSRNFFETLCRMQDNVVFFYAVSEGRIISAELVLYGADTCYSFLGGTDNNYFQMRPNDFLKYEVIKWAKEKGLKYFVLGGGYGQDDGIFQYKQALAPNGVVDFYIGRRVFDQASYDYLVNLRVDSILSEGYFPIYRG